MASNGSDEARDQGAGTRPPRIGLTAYRQQARWTIWDRQAVVLSYAYVQAVLDVGGVPVVLPPAGDRAAAASAIDGIDALVLTGGDDVDPVRYGAETHPETDGVHADRDRWELDLLAEALDRDLPVLAICRGIQILNVLRGGTLDQHLPDRVSHEGHRPEPGVMGTTRVRLAPGSPMASILGAELKVLCHHHQAIGRVGKGIVAVGWAEDGTIEAAAVPDRRFVLAVQWHPEDDDDPRLFDALVAAARTATRRG